MATDVVGNGAVAVAGSGAVAVVEMVADKVAGSGAAFSNMYAVASVVVFTIYRSPTLVPEMKIPKGDDLNTLCPNMERAPVRSSQLTERRETRNVGIYSTSRFDRDI